MKKIVFAICITCCSYISVNAQQGGGMQERMRQVLKDSVQLTDVQVDSVMSVQHQYQPQMREIFMDQSLSQDEKMAKMQPIRDSIKIHLSTFLTPDQIQKYDDVQKNMRQRMMNRQGGGGGNN